MNSYRELRKKSSFITGKCVWETRVKDKITLLEIFGLLDLERGET
jgi:hypothetical protein